MGGNNLDEAIDVGKNDSLKIGEKPSYIIINIAKLIKMKLLSFYNHFIL